MHDPTALSAAGAPRPANVEELSRLVAACPSPAAGFALDAVTGEPIMCVAANSAALALLRLEADEAGVREVLSCLHDEREPAFCERLRACVRGESAPELRVLARRTGSAAPFASSVPARAEVLLEARFSALAGGVVAFFEVARARGADDLPMTVEPAAAQRAMFDIARATHEAPTLAALFARIDEIVEQLIGTRNFYVALVDEAEQMMRFPYARDEFDPPHDRRLGLGVTDVVYFTRQPLLLDRATANRMLADGAIINHGVPAQVWLGVPLAIGGRTVGVMAVQDYHNPHRVGEAERRLLTYISAQIAGAIALKRSDDAAAAARAEADAARRAKAEFVGVMSHELRTPLTAVLGFSELLKESLAGTVEGKQAASIEQAGLRLLKTINHLLDFSRIDAQDEPVHDEPVNLEDLLVRCHAEIVAQLREKNLTYTVRREGFVPEWMCTDGALLRQILLHLLGNAVKFTPVAGRVRVVLRATPTVPFEAGRHRLEITVEDTGIGITPEAQTRLFEPFERAHAPGTVPGVGLGLAIAQRLATLLGGKISVRSAPTDGSAFTLAIKAQAWSPAGAGAGAELPDANAQREIFLRSRLAGSDWTLLVVDAQPDNRAMLAALVGSVIGAEVLVAAGTREALALAAETPSLIALVDVAGAGSDGLGLCRALGSLAGGARRVIALSVDHSPALVRECLDAGADNYVPKPVNRRALLEALLAVTERDRRQG